MQSDKPEPSEANVAEGPSARDGDKKALSAVETGAGKAKGISAVAVLWTFGKCLSALLPIYLAGYYRVSTSLLVCGMMVYTGWKHAREAKEARLKSAMELDDEQEHTSTRMSKIKRDLPAWVRKATRPESGSDNITALSPTVTLLKSGFHVSFCFL